MVCVLIGLITAFDAEAAQGRECEGVSFPEQVQLQGATLKLNGLGLRQATFLKVDVQEGERLRFAYQPGADVHVDVDGKVKGTIKGDDFARALFSIWLGAHPPNADLKAGLLGGECG